MLTGFQGVGPLNLYQFSVSDKRYSRLFFCFCNLCQKVLFVSSQDHFNFYILVVPPQIVWLLIHLGSFVKINIPLADKNMIQLSCMLLTKIIERHEIAFLGYKRHVLSLFANALYSDYRSEGGCVEPFHAHKGFPCHLPMSQLAPQQSCIKRFRLATRNLTILE